jgi:hypothetical protein
MDDAGWGTTDDALTERPRREVALSHPAAVLALVVALDGRRLREVARALELRIDGGREDLAMRIAGEAARTNEGDRRLVRLLATEELRCACDEVLGLPAHGGRAALVRRLERWLSLFVVEDDDDEPAPLIGGRWRLGKLREAVPAGTLHEASDVRLPGRPPAVALVAHLPAQLALEAEVLVGLRLTHPAIVRVLDHGVDDAGRDVAIMDDPGAPLLRWLSERGPAPVDLATRQTLALAAALDHARAAGARLPGVDASRVWVDRDEQVRLSGFGRSSGEATDDQPGLARLFMTLVSGQVASSPERLRLDASRLAALRRGLSAAPAERFSTCLDLALALLGAGCA